MSVRERIVDGDTRFGYMRIRSGGYDLIVETRELYTSYRIVKLFNWRHSYYSQDSILYHSVRTPEPVPIRPAHIIHAKHIPWFLWIVFLIRDAIEKRRWAREMKLQEIRQRARINAIRALADKNMAPGRFKGRYN